MITDEIDQSRIDELKAKTKEVLEKQTFINIKVLYQNCLA